MLSLCSVAWGRRSPIEHNHGGWPVSSEVLARGAYELHTCFIAATYMEWDAQSFVHPFASDSDRKSAVGKSLKHRHESLNALYFEH
jgi:hypothetical protein